MKNKIKVQSPVKLLKAIGISNNYFHQELEKFPDVKRDYYHVKDEVVKGIITRAIVPANPKHSLGYNFDWIDIDKEGKRYAALTLFADNNRDNISVKVHFPLRKLPKNLIPEKYEILNYEHNSTPCDYEFQEFVDAYAYMLPVAKQMYQKKVESYNQRQLLAMLGESFINARLPYRIVLEKEYKKPVKNILIYTKEPTTVFTTISMAAYKKAVCEVLTFDAKKVFRLLGYEVKKVK